MKYLKWLYPGLGVKRWLFLNAVGIVFFVIGLGLIVDYSLLGKMELSVIEIFYHLTGRLLPESTWISGLFIISAGLFFICLGIKKTIHTIFTELRPECEQELVDLMFNKKQLERGPRLVALGGGTGLSTLLRGLKQYTSNITAIVTVTDDGGSSGRLRTEMGILPPGDIRNCLVALADTEPLMGRLFQHRFNTQTALSGHSFGNLFIAAMSEITGDFEEAVKESSKILAVRGQVLPSTLDDVSLEAEMIDGSRVEGESRIAGNQARIRDIWLNPQDAAPRPEALDAIARADAIILGPGSLYTSILPNLLISDLREAIRSSEAAKFYVCNVMTQPGETDGFTAVDHVQTLLDCAGELMFDYVLINSEPVPRALQSKYKKEGAEPVTAGTAAEIEAIGFEAVLAPMISKEDVVRHDPQKLGRVIMTCLLKNDDFRETRGFTNAILDGLEGLKIEG